MSVTKPDSKVFKYQVDIRSSKTGEDTTMVSTDIYKEAQAEYDRLKAILDEQLHACSFDTIAFYVVETSHPGDYTPIVFAQVETKVSEW